MEVKSELKGGCEIFASRRSFNVAAKYTYSVLQRFSFQFKYFDKVYQG